MNSYSLVTATARSAIRRSLVSRPLATRSLASFVVGRPASSFTSASTSNPSVVRSYSKTSLLASSDNNSSLIEILRREHDEEVDSNNLDMPSELQQLKSQVETSGWKIVDHGATTRLIRTLNNQKIQISFHCQDQVVDESRFFEEMTEDGVEQEIEEEELASRVRFTVTSTKAGHKTLVLTCLADEAQAMVESVVVSTQSVDEILKTGSVAAEQYQGPDFAELAEDLQEGFQEYLQETLEVNESVTAFIGMYADYREQVEYVQFLKDAQDVVG
jgi:complement component 1 Q subcomponent-binding protein